MDEGRLTSISDARGSSNRDEELRARVREAVAELDQIIRMAEA